MQGSTHTPAGAETTQWLQTEGGSQASRPRHAENGLQTDGSAKALGEAPVSSVETPHVRETQGNTGQWDFLKVRSGWLSKDTVQATKSQVTDREACVRGRTCCSSTRGDDTPSVKRATAEQTRLPTRPAAHEHTDGSPAAGHRGCAHQLGHESSSLRGRSRGCGQRDTGQLGGVRRSFGGAVRPGKAPPGEAPRGTGRMSSRVFMAALSAVAAWRSGRRPLTGGQTKGHSATTRGAGWTLGTREGKEPDAQRYVLCHFRSCERCRGHAC